MKNEKKIKIIIIAVSALIGIAVTIIALQLGLIQ